jgi:hypothetical protein
MTLPIAAERATRAIRWVHLAFGAWLIASAFLLRHTPQSSSNTWVVGLLTAVVAFASLFSWHGVLRINAIFSLWLLLSTLLVPYASWLTQLHNAIVALTLIVLAVMPARLVARRAGEERGEGAAQQRAPA